MKKIFLIIILVLLASPIVFKLGKLIGEFISSLF